MRRREVIAGISVAGIAGPLRLRAQPTGKPIFGILLVFSREGGRTFTDPIRGYLEALGSVDGRNIELDFRHADGNVDRLAMIATELVARRALLLRRRLPAFPSWQCRRIWFGRSSSRICDIRARTPPD